MQPLETVGTSKELRKLTKSERAIEFAKIRIGEFYTKYSINQKRRFHRIVHSIARHYGIALNQAPIETLLIRRISINTIEAEDLKVCVMDNPRAEDALKIREFLIKLDKEIREAMVTLVTILKVDNKKLSANKYKDIRKALRNEQGLETTDVETAPDGKDRRYLSQGYATGDGITRIAKVENEKK